MVKNPFEKYHYLLEKYIDPRAIPVLYAYWSSGDRHWHTMDHLIDIIAYIEKFRRQLNMDEFEQLILAAFYHDAIYNPRDHSLNEDKSKELFRQDYIGKDQKFELVDKAIDCTKYRKKPPFGPIRIFWEADNQVFRKTWMSILKWEKEIRKEYAHIPEDIYKEARIKFLSMNVGLFGPKGDTNIRKLIEYIRDK